VGGAAQKPQSILLIQQILQLAHFLKPLSYSWFDLPLLKLAGSEQLIIDKVFAYKTISSLDLLKTPNRYRGFFGD